jgi:hypothetical protein
VVTSLLPPTLLKRFSGLREMKLTCFLKIDKIWLCLRASAKTMDMTNNVTIGFR